MQTVLDVDERLLSLAEQQARWDGDDAFFTTFEEIRALGRVPAQHRQTALCLLDLTL